MKSNNLDGKKTKIWFATHTTVSYLRDQNKLMCGLKDKTNVPAIACFEKKQIHSGDKVVYYGFDSHLISGLYRVVSEQKSGKDSNDKKMVYYDIERVTPANNDGFLDVVKLSEYGKDHFIAFKQ